MNKIISLLLLAIFPALAQWNQTNFNNIRVLLSMDFYNYNAALGGWSDPFATGKAFYSTDAGITWLPAQLPDSTRAVVEIAMVNENLAFACGAKNLVISSKNLPLDYKEILSSPFKLSLYKKGIFPGNTDSDYKGLFMESTNGGQSWHSKGSFPDSVEYFVNLEMTSSSTGYLLANGTGAYPQGILKTTDGGNTWNWVYIPNGDVRINSFSFADNENGYIAGNYGENDGIILRTTNGGLNWTSSIYMDIYYEQIKCITANKIVVLGASNPISPDVLISEDGGANFTGGHSFGPENVLVDGINGNSSWIICYGTYYPTGSSTPFVLGTTDNGQTWTQRTLSPLTDIVMTSSSMLSDSQWYITGTHMGQTGFILSTINSGGLPVELISFSAERTGNSVLLEWITTSEKNNAGFEIERRTSSSGYRTIGFLKGHGTTSEKNVYTFTDSPGYPNEKLIYRLKQVDFDGHFSYSDEAETEFTTVTEFSLLQNYPNPFNPSTKITYNIPENGIVSLKVFNSLGKETVSLVNEFKTAGTYTINFDADELPGGVYFCRLSTSSYSKVLKMLLLK